MKIRSWLLLSSLSIILLILLVDFIGSGILLESLHNHFKEASEELAQNISSQNSRLAEDVLSHYGERVVALQADSLLNELSHTLEDQRIRPGDYRYDAIRRNDKLRALTTQDILARGDKVGYFDLMDDRGNYVLHPNAGVEGGNFEQHREMYPEMYDIVQRSFTEPNVQGYYSFLDGDETRRKFMVIRAVPGYQFRLVAAVNISDYFLPIQQDIRTAQEAVSADAEAKFQTEYRRYINRLRLAGLVVAIVVFVVTLLMSAWFAGRIARPLQELSERFQRMAEGDFTQPAHEQGALEARRLAASYNSLREHVGALLRQVQRSGIQLMSTATEIAATARQQESTVNDFGAATHQVMAAAKQISTTSQDLVRTMGEVSRNSRQTADGAGEGRRSIEHMQQRMSSVTTATRSFADKLSVISSHARDISSVVDTITKVADQTNLLSLNAAIEAEKAGEVGLGFSVVAREIRRLADQTAVATLDIEKTVKRMQDSVASGVREMERFATQVGESAEDTAHIGDRLENVIEDVQRLQPRFESVNEGMQMQAEGAGQITQAMVQLNENARQTAQSVSEFNKATQQLKEAALTLQKETKFFRVEG